jgi:hypothetical protein
MTRAGRLGYKETDIPEDDVVQPLINTIQNDAHPGLGLLKTASGRTSRNIEVRMELINLPYLTMWKWI